VSAAALLFSYVDTYPNQIKQFLSQQLNIQLEFDQFLTTWERGNPGFLMTDFKLVNSKGEVKAAFDHLAGRSYGYSWLYFWPRFSDIAIDSPNVVIESLSDGGIKVGGVLIKPTNNKRQSSFMSLAWLLSQEHANLSNGDFVWKHTDGSKTQFGNIAANFSRQGSSRQFMARLDNAKGVFGMDFDVEGNVLSKDDWSAEMNMFSGEQAIAMNARKIQLTVANGKGEINIPELYAERAMDIVRMVGAGSSIERKLLAADFKGLLRNVRLGFSGSLVDLEDWDLTASGQNLSWSSSESFPGIDSVDAQLSIDKKGGLLDFNIGSASLYWPKYFSEPLDINTANGRLSLRFNNNSMHLKLLDAKLHNDDVNFDELEFSFDKSAGVTPYGVFKTRFHTQQLDRVEHYFPRRTRQKFRQWWKTAFKDMGEANGTLSYVGDIDKAALNNNRASVSGKATVENVVLNYGFEREWPVFVSPKLELYLQNDTLNLSANEGELEKAKAKNVKAKITKLFSKKRLLSINSELSGSTEYLVDFLQTGPLVFRRKAAQKPIEYVQVEEGSYQGRLLINLPLNAVSKVKVSGELQLTDTELKVPSGLALAALNGRVEFTENSVSAENVKANLLGGDALINVSTIERGAPPSLRFSGAGKLNSENLSLWLGNGITSRFQGETNWSGYVDITKQGVKVDVESALEGVEVALPEPFAKSATETRELSIAFKSGAQLRNSLDVSIGKEIAMNFHSLTNKEGNLLDSGHIRVGKVKPVDSEIAGVTIDIVQKAVDVDQWIEALTAISRVPTKAPINKKTKVNFVDQLRKIEINTQNLTLFSKPLGGVKATATAPDGKTWQTLVSGESMDGSLVLEPFEKPSRYTLNLQRLLWPHTPKDKNGDDRKAPPRLVSDDRQPSSWPIVLGSVQEFSALGKSLGKMEINASPQNDKWLINDFRLSRDGVDVIASGEWQRRANENLTETKLKLALNSRSAGAALEDLGFEELLKDGSVKFSSDLNWLGAPSDFHMSRLDGTYELSVRKGRFPKVNPKSGRLFGLLNVNNLTRRLRLDFKDVFGSGLAFDRMESSGFVVQGDLLLKSFFIYSPSVYVQANGRVGLAKEDYDMQLLVSPQLGGNIALLSALSNPAAGAVVFLAQKVFKKQFDQAIVYTYSVDGPWKEPVIERVENE